MSKVKLYNNLPTMSVEEYNKYLEEVELGYISMNKHPEDKNIIILNYTDTTVYERRWNEQTLNARGLILDITNARYNRIVVLAKPFKKFFNYGENPEMEKNIDLNKIKTVMDKMDGSLGISYYFKGEIRFATRGSFSSEQAIEATKIWNEKYAKNFNFKTNTYYTHPYTMLVEIIYPSNRIVVNYGNERSLTILGIIDLASVNLYEELSLYSIQLITKHLNMPMVKVCDKKSLDELVRKSKELSYNSEGWVVTFEGGHKLKIKGEEYLKIHRLIYGLSTKRKYLTWAEGKLLDHIKLMPEELREEYELFEKKMNDMKNEKVKGLQFFFNYIHTDDRKLFAQRVEKLVDKKYKKYMFKAFNTGIIDEGAVKLDMAKNYLEYEVMINE